MKYELYAVEVPTGPDEFELERRYDEGGPGSVLTWESRTGAQQEIDRLKAQSADGELEVRVVTLTCDDEDGLVDAVLFNEHGSFAHAVLLDYRQMTQEEYEDWDLRKQAKAALKRATDAGVSRTDYAAVPESWSLVVMSPRSMNSYPTMVRGGFAGLADALIGGQPS